MYFSMILAVVAGFCMPFQAALNARLGVNLGSPLTAALVSFAIGTICLLVTVLFLRIPLPGFQGFTQVPTVYFVGGVIGAVFVALITVLVSKLGAATMVALILCGQVFASMLMDHYGWLGVQRHPIGVARILGGVLLVLGMVLIKRS